MSKLDSLLDQIESGSLLLPEFQRGYVWNRDQVRGLFQSLYRGFPVGSLLVWETEADHGATRGGVASSGGTKQLLLDGQQRLTSLYGVMRGRAPAFFEGDAKAFTGLHFNIADETFEFYAPAKMAGDPLWVDVSRLFVEGMTPQIQALSSNPVTAPGLAEYLTRINTLYALSGREFHAEKITGSRMTVDVVVDIFNRVNSGGTKLSRGDLALAKICAQWPEARAAMREQLGAWRGAGYEFSLDWLLRSVNAVATGKAPFAALSEVSSADFQVALKQAGHHVGTALAAIQGRLGLDHNRVLMGRYAIPVIARYLQVHGEKGHFPSSSESDRILYWYVQSAIWGRFAGSTETVLAQDYDAAERGGADGLIESLSRWRGNNLTVQPHDFDGFGLGSRFYPLLYLMSRMGGAQDWGSGLPLKQEMLGPLTGLQVHHIFPKAYLYAHDYSRGQVNAVANFCILTQKTNLQIGKRPPHEYFAEIAERWPGALESQWVPTDPSLWKVENYPAFLEARRALLAEAANTILNGLAAGSSAPEAALPKAQGVPEPVVDAEPDLAAMIDELLGAGCVEPELDVEIPDPETGRPLAVAEAFWPQGLQPGIGSPVVLELDPQDADLARLQELDYEVFPSIESLLRAVRRRNLIAAGKLASM